MVYRNGGRTWRPDRVVTILAAGEDVLAEVSEVDEDADVVAAGALCVDWCFGDTRR